VPEKTSALDHFDTVNDLISETITAFNEPADPPQNLTPAQQALADRLRLLLNANLQTTQVLLHDYAEAIGLFDDRPEARP